MAYSWTGVSATGSGVNSATTGNIDSSGADVLFVVVSYDPGSDPTVSDNKGNTYGIFGQFISGTGQPYCSIYYSTNSSPSVGSGHNWTASKTSGFMGVCAAPFSGPPAASPGDQTNNKGSSGVTTLTPATGITPTENNELIIDGLSYSTGTSNDQTIDIGTIIAHVNFSGGNNYGCVMAFHVQTTATAENPTWTWTGSTDAGAVIASFKLGTATAVKHFLAILGVGQ